MPFRPTIVLRTAAASALVLALAGPAGPALAGGAAASEQDQAYLVAAHQSNLTEIASGEAAQADATSGDIRELGGMLVADHTRLDASVTALAEKYGVDLPTTPNQEQQAGIAEVEASGDAFDETWTRVQLDGHLKSKANGAKQIAEGEAEDVVAGARTAAPVVQGHIDELAAIADDLGVSVPAAVEGGTGGHAAGHVESGSGGLAATPFLALGAALLAGAGAVALRRRTTAGRDAR